MAAPNEAELEDDTDTSGKADDDRDLVLNDNYAIWERHNNWLADAVGPTKVWIIEPPVGQLTLVRSGADNQGQWQTAVGQSRPINIAKEHGFLGEHYLWESGANGGLVGRTTVIAPVGVYPEPPEETAFWVSPPTASSTPSVLL